MRPLTREHIDFIDLIRGTPLERNQAIHLLMNDSNLHQKLVSMICNNSGTKDEGEIIFDDMILMFIKKLCLTIILA